MQKQPRLSGWEAEHSPAHLGVSRAVSNKSLMVSGQNQKYTPTHQKSPTLLVSTSEP